MFRCAQLIFELCRKAPEGKITIDGLELAAEAAHVVTGEICIGRDSKTVGDPALDLQLIILRVVVAFALAAAVGCPKRKLGLARLFGRGRVDVAEIRRGYRRAAGDQGEASRDDRGHDTRHGGRSLLLLNEPLMRVVLNCNKAVT